MRANLPLFATYHPPGKMPDIFWLAKVFSSVMSVRSGQISKVHRFAKIWLNILSPAGGKAVN